MRSITITLMGISLFLILMYDLVALLVAGNEATISAVIIEWSHVYPIIPFAFGVLMGHFFWQIKTVKIEQ